MRGAARGGGWLLAALLWGACGGPMEEVEQDAVADVAPAPELETQEQAAHTSAIRTRWVRTHDGVDFRQVAFDGAGNLYVALSYRGPATLTGVALPWNGDPEDYHFGVAKFRPDHSLAWVRGYGPARVTANVAYANVTGFTVTRGGTVYVGGEAQQDGVRIGSQTLANGTFLVRLGSDGSLRWARATRPEPQSDFTFVSLAAHPSAGFYALARFRRFSDGPRQPRLMLIRYGSDGEARWGNIYEQRAGGTATPGGLAVDVYGNTYVSGYGTGEVSFGGATGSSGEMKPFVFSTSAFGRQRWTRFLPLTGRGYADGIAVGGGRVVVGVVTSRDNAFVLGMSTVSGAQRWRHDLGDVSGPLALSTTHGARDEVVLGVGSGDASAFGRPRQSPGLVLGNTSFVARLRRSDGRFVSARNLELRREDDDNYLRAESIAVSGGGSLAACGIFDGTVDFGLGPRSGSGSSFVLRAAP